MALYQIQHDGIGRAADRRAELNRKINNPTAVKNWEDVPAALNAWETAALEYFYITGREPDAETQMNSLLRLLPKSLYDIVATQYGITTYDQMKTFVLGQCTRFKHGQHGHGETGAGNGRVNYVENIREEGGDGQEESGERQGGPGEEGDGSGDINQVGQD